MGHVWQPPLAGPDLTPPGSLGPALSAIPSQPLTFRGYTVTVLT